MIRTIILGIGNATSALVQGLAYYQAIEKNHNNTGDFGLWHPIVGNYKISDIEIVGDFDEIMGHAGAVVRDRNGNFQGASDPRCDGAALAP